jgi:hypothetical protein
MVVWGLGGGEMADQVLVVEKKHYIGGGISLGTLIAVLCSWSVNHSVLWAVIHGFLGWIYVIYYLIVY